MNVQRFSIDDVNKLVPTEDSCLELLYEKRYGNLEACPRCKKKAKFYRVSGRKCYSCQYCGHQIHPLSDTIFHKSRTRLKTWFMAFYYYMTSNNGIAANELAAKLKVTYKCASRINAQIRRLFDENSVVKPLLSGIVEVDEMYVGGRRHGKRGRGAAGKTAVFGILQRDGEVRIFVVPNTTRRTLMPIIRRNVKTGTKIMSDNYKPYLHLTGAGYEHHFVNHSIGEYVRGEVHTNTIEGFWRIAKRSIGGTHHWVSPKNLQSYLDFVSFRYNHRNSPKPLFLIVLEERIARPFS